MSADDMVKIPFSKSEIFMNKVLTLKEKRLLVKVIEMCLQGTDKHEQLKKEEENIAGGASKTRNSTH